MASKSPEEIIHERRLRKIEWLRSCCNEIIKCAQQTVKKIDNNGLAENFSCNHDIEKWAERVHRASYELWLLGDMESILNEERSNLVKVNVEWDRDDD